ncbi:MAG: baseplate J/gp47 family protein [Myxococcota bacterium]
MSSRYLRWEQAEADGDFQGIDYVALALLPTPQAPTAAELTVHLQRTSTGSFTASDFELSGGSRVTSLPMTLASQTASTVTLALAGVGDASPYTITMLGGAGAPVHPFFAAATFTFAIDCELGDCRPLEATASRRVGPRPVVDLVTKDYRGFVGLSADWIKIRNPHWADLSPSSLERTLVELLAHHGDMLSYYQDRVANEAFIEDASARHSLRQHGVLLGTTMFDSAAAETVLALGAESHGYVKEGAQVTTKLGDERADIVFHVTARSRVVPDHETLKLAAWPGATTAALPQGADELLLWGEVDELLVGQSLALVQGELGKPGSHTEIVTITAVAPDAQPGWAEEPGPIIDPTPGMVPVTIVRFHPPLARSFTPWSGLGLTIYGNLAPARFGQQVTSRIELSEAATAVRRNYLVEHRRGKRARLRGLLVPEAPVGHRLERLADGTEVTVPMLEVSAEAEPWTRVPHLHGSQAYDRHYVATAEEEGGLWLQFGDGVHGRALELAEAGDAPSELELRYYVGEPVAGNCGAGVLMRFVPGQEAGALVDFTTVPSVKNVLPGRGGRQPETKDAARLRLPASLRHGPLRRAVTLADYAEAARAVPGVARAVAKNLGGPFNAVLVLCDPEGRITLDPEVVAAVERRIDAVRMAGREHFVRAPSYVPLEVVLSVCVEVGVVVNRVRDAVLAALLPGEVTAPGFFHPDELSFGEDVALADVLARVQRMPGVRSVKARRFRRADVLDAPLVQTRIALAPTEVARLDGDPALPEYGRLEVYVKEDELDDPQKYAPYLVEEAP